MPLADKIQFRGLFACTTRKGCPQTQDMPQGCPLWRDEIWENEEGEPIRMQGCGFIVDAKRQQWTASRAFQAATIAQAGRTEQAAVLNGFQQFFKLAEHAGLMIENENDNGNT